ncbi:MAG: HEAT repeat domain-containing protein, partial [Planctomycetota bacterium]|nr:HEAT repeat domain-containing protein [Planctomycetota bacterium]
LMALSHADAGLRPKIVEALGRLGDRSALQTIIGLLSDPDEKVQLSAVRAVQKIPDMRAVKPIIDILPRTQNAELRLQSVVALATSGNQKAVAILSALLPGADVALQKAIAEALTHFSSPEASETLARLLHAEDLAVVVKALTGLRKTAMPSTIPILMQLCDHFNANVRRHALEALAENDDEAICGILEKKLLNDLSAEVRVASARCLGRLGDRKAIVALERSLKDESAVRSAAAVSLGSLGDESAIPALLALLKDPAPEVRYHSVSGLGKLKADKAVRSIREMLEDSNEMVRHGAEKALQDLGVKRVSLSLPRRFASHAGRLIPDRFAGVLPGGATLAGLAGFFAVTTVVWLASSSLTAGTDNALAIARARPVTQVCWIPDSFDVILLRAGGSADIWDAETGEFKSKVDAPELRSVGYPETLMSRQDASLDSWTPDGKLASNRTIKLPPSEQFNLSGNGALAVYLDKAGRVARWDTSKGIDIGYIALKASPLPVMNADGSFVAGSGAEGDIVIIDRVTGKQIGTAGQAGSIRQSGDGLFNQMLFSSEGNSLAVLRSNCVVLINVTTQELDVRKFDEMMSASIVQFPSLSSLYAASGSSIKTLDLTTGKVRSYSVTHQEIEINSFSISSDTTLAVASADNKKYGWVLNLNDGKSTELSPSAWPAE